MRKKWRDNDEFALNSALWQKFLYNFGSKEISQDSSWEDGAFERDVRYEKERQLQKLRISGKRSIPRKSIETSENVFGQLTGLKNKIKLKINNNNDYRWM